MPSETLEHAVLEAEAKLREVAELLAAKPRTSPVFNWRGKLIGRTLDENVSLALFERAERLVSAAVAAGVDINQKARV